MDFEGLLRRLDDNSHVRGRQFERLCKWYLENDPVYTAELEKVWLWADWPGRWGPDAGIDLVAEAKDGRLWAIQAKAYSEDNSITKADADTFLSESNRPQFTYRLLIATTDLLSANARRAIEGQEKPVGLLLRGWLEQADIEWPDTPEVLEAPKKPKKEPRPHQEEAINDCVEGFRKNKRGQLIMACGTGKTLVALWAKERLKSKRTLVLVPSLSLLSQTLREWVVNAKKPFEYLAVCSDETVVGEDHFVTKASELGLPVTTEPNEIASYLSGKGERVVFATYQSSSRVAEALQSGSTQFNLCIADEAHRCAGRVGTDFTTVLDDEKIRSKHKLFMTATPRYFTENVRREAGEVDLEVASMDDEEKFGPPLHTLNFGKAISLDLLSDYRVVVVGVTDQTYKDFAETGRLITLDGDEITDARTLASHIALAKTMRKYDLRRTITFHGRIKTAKSFSNDIPTIIDWMPKSSRPSGELWSQNVSGEMTSGKRDTLLRQFRNLGSNTRGVLTNARCLGEGVDVPTIDGIAFIDPRRSKINIIQALGRAIRKAQNKKLGTVVIPVFVDPEEDTEEMLSTSAFKHVWDVVNALRAHDEVLGEEIDELRRQLGRHKKIRKTKKIVFDMPDEVDKSFARAFNIKLVESTSASWEFWFGLLQKYVEREGDALVPAKHRKDGYNLGRWVVKQRTAYKNGKLSQDHIDRLEKLPEWEWSQYEASWEEHYEMLKQYVDREGNALVPAKHRKDGYNLGRWVIKQRGVYQNGDLSPDRIKRLEALSGWVWNTREASWEEHYVILKQYVEREGHALVPRSHKSGRWVTNQRTAYKNGKLSQDRIDRLEKLPGWVWSQLEVSWEEHFIILKKCVDKEGNARVPSLHIEDGFNLGNWVNFLRTAYKNGKLTQDRIDRLEKLPGWVWDAR